MPHFARCAPRRIGYFWTTVFSGGDVSGADGHQAATAAERFAAAHRALRDDPTVQFVMHPVQPLPEPPAWLVALGRFLAKIFRPIGRLLRWIGSLMPDAPYARILLWSALAALLIVIGLLVYQRVRHGEWRLPRRRVRSVPPAIDTEEWAPEAAPARAWLEEADRLAEEGKFAEAAHLLLFRSVEDIARRRPRLVRPALTSRELASADVIPLGARDLFARIARLVERSLFGGRPVDAADWQGARAAYADFVLPGAWRG